MRPTPPPAIDLLGCPVGRAQRDRWRAYLLQCASSDAHHHHVSLNAAKWVAMRDDADLRNIVRTATSVAADGAAIVLASRRLGDALPERVTGCDLAHDLLQQAPQRGMKVALFGAAPEIVDEVARRWRARGVSIVYARDGYAGEDEYPQIAAQIAAASPHLLLVAMGTPKSERFIARFLDTMQVPLSMGVGGCFDVMAGVVRRSPEVLSRMHLEWAWRLAGEPRVRFRRAILASVQFVSAVARRERLPP